MEVYPLSEGAFTIGHDKVFTPFDIEKDVLEVRPRGSLLVEVQPFLVVRDADLILLDTGLGFSDAGGHLQVHSALRRLGYEPEDITRVLMSHLHKDHAGGLLYKDNSGNLRPSFPNALHSIARKEWDFAVETGPLSYHPNDFLALEEQARIEWLWGEGGIVDTGIYWEHTGGHSKEHIVFRIEGDGGQTIFYGGDEAPQLKQMKMQYIARYDYDGRRAMELRKGWMQEGKAAGWEALFYHDIKTPTAKLG